MSRFSDFGPARDERFAEAPGCLAFMASGDCVPLLAALGADFARPARCRRTFAIGLCHNAAPTTRLVARTPDSKGCADWASDLGHISAQAVVCIFLPFALGNHRCVLCFYCDQKQRRSHQNAADDVFTVWQLRACHGSFASNAMATDRAHIGNRLRGPIRAFPTTASK